MLTRWLIRRRDAAAERWLREGEVRRARRAHALLVVWDTLLDIWTDRGRRHTPVSHDAEEPPWPHHR